MVTELVKNDRTGECTVKELTRSMIWEYGTNSVELCIPINDYHYANVIVLITHLESMRVSDDFQRKIMLQESDPSIIEFIRFKLSKLWRVIINSWNGS